MYCKLGFRTNRSCDAPDTRSLVEALCLGKAVCSITDSAGFFGTVTGGCAGNPTPHKLAVSLGCGTHPSFAVDFEQEFQGGLVLNVNGKAGQRVKISAGELIGKFAERYNVATNSPIVSDGGVGQDWGNEFIWTLREGPQEIVQHNYAERWATAAIWNNPLNHLSEIGSIFHSHSNGVQEERNTVFCSGKVLIRRFCVLRFRIQFSGPRF